MNAPVTAPQAKFSNPDFTAKGEQRATVPFDHLKTLWINTGTLCNITCSNCYIESSPTNDRLAYITAAEVAPFLVEARTANTREIGYTGGEPYMNPEFLQMLRATVEAGFATLVLTNAMQPMQRRQIAQGLLALNAEHGEALTHRVSLDHYTQALHESERGENTWERALTGMDWLDANGFRMTIAGRTCWGENEVVSRAGYGRLIAERGWNIDADDPAQLILFPEMSTVADVPEITTACWGILGKTPSDIMCSSSRMVVKRKGADHPVVLPCTLLPYDTAFEMGGTLAEAAAADGGMFADGAVKLCHPYCAKFCVLGGGSCS